MTNQKILVTGVGGDIGVNILRCLKEGSYANDLIGCDRDPYAWGRSVSPKFLQAPSALEKVAYEQFIQNTVKKYNIGYVYPGSEPEILFFHKHRDSFKDWGIKVLINNAMIVDNFLDKYKTAIFLAEKNLPSPKTFLLEQYKGELSYPFILKKRWGSGSKLVLVVCNQNEFEFYKNKFGIESLIVQEYLGSEEHEYTAGVFSNGNQTYSILFRRYLASDVGITKFAEFIEENPIAELASRIAEVSHLIGSINIQFRKVNNKFIPFEINPRISGTAYIRHYFGFRDIEWWLKLLMKKEIKTYDSKFNKGIAVRAVQEVFLDVS